MKYVDILNSSSFILVEKEYVLDEFEYFVYQIDNVRDLDIIGGLSLVIKFMNFLEEGFRRRVCYVLGLVVQR